MTMYDPENPQHLVYRDRFRAALRRGKEQSPPAEQQMKDAVAERAKGHDPRPVPLCGDMAEALYGAKR